MALDYPLQRLCPVLQLLVAGTSGLLQQRLTELEPAIDLGRRLP